MTTVPPVAIALSGFEWTASQPTEIGIEFVRHNYFQNPTLVLYTIAFKASEGLSVGDVSGETFLLKGIY